MTPLTTKLKNCDNDDDNDDDEDGKTIKLIEPNGCG